jgi:hypothetical protein
LVAERAAVLSSIESRPAQISGKKIVENCSESSASFENVRISSGLYNVDRSASARRGFNNKPQSFLVPNGISANYLFVGGLA